MSVAAANAVLARAVPGRAQAPVAPTAAPPIAGLAKAPALPPATATKAPAQPPALTPSAAKRQPPSPSTGALRLAQFNVLNLFDTVDGPSRGPDRLSPAEYELKLTKLSLAIRDELGSPDVIALQEIENEQVLKDLVARPELKHLGYESVIMPGNDLRGINVAVLYRKELVSLRNAEQFNTKVKGLEPAKGQIDPALLFARPPLVVDFEHRGAAQAAEGAGHLTLIVNHFKSKLGGSGFDIRRVHQAEAVAGIVDARRAADPYANVIVLGDLNALPREKPIQKLLRNADGTRRLVDTALRVPHEERYTYVYRGKKNLLDHIMVTPELDKSVLDMSIKRISTGATEEQIKSSKTGYGASDHDPMILALDLNRAFRMRQSELAASATR